MELIDIITEHQKWVFSGIGTLLVSGLAALLWRSIQNRKLTDLSHKPEPSTISIDGGVKTQGGGDAIVSTGNVTKQINKSLP